MTPESFFRLVDNYFFRTVVHIFGLGGLQVDLCGCIFHFVQHFVQSAALVAALKKSILRCEFGPVKTVIFVVEVTAPVTLDKKPPSWADTFYS
jgi:hypothetical protein